MYRPRQRELRFRTWGGTRSRAGRKPKLERPGVAHCVRPEHAKRHPVHVTMRADQRLPSLRKQRVFVEMRRAFARTDRSWFRIVHFSVQTDHLHLIVEADDKVSLSRGLVGVAVRLARAVNGVLVRRGRVWADRYHARVLATPREVRHGLVYVLMNFRKHLPGARGLDACSSAWRFDGWKIPPCSWPPENASDQSPVRPPETWLARTGWKRHGLIGQNERPKRAP
jgi:putative transposase